MPKAVRCEIVEGRRSPVFFQEIRPLGIGRLTACTTGTLSKPGMLLGSRKGLFHLPHPEAKPQRLRRSPVGYVLSGESGAVCYEEAGKHGRLVILDDQLRVRRVDSGLVREINPKAFWKNGLVILHRGEFAFLDFETGERKRVAGFVETRLVGPLALVGESYEFIAIHRGPEWPTYLHSFAPGVEDDAQEVAVVAQLDDPIGPRHFLRLPRGDYLLVPQGRAIFLILTIYPGEKPGLRPWALVPIAGDAHPVGLALLNGKLYAACSDSLLTFGLSEELLEAE